MNKCFQNARFMRARASPLLLLSSLVWLWLWKSVSMQSAQSFRIPTPFLVIIYSRWCQITGWPATTSGWKWNGAINHGIRAELAKSFTNFCQHNWSEVFVPSGLHWKKWKRVDPSHGLSELFSLCCGYTLLNQLKIVSDVDWHLS